MDIFKNKTLNMKIKTEYPNSYDQIFTQRKQRKTEAFEAHMTFEYMMTPLPDRNSLQFELNLHLSQQKVFDSPYLRTRIDEARNKLLTGDYAHDNTPDWYYRQEFLEKVNSFIWPTEEEKIKQQEEENYLMSLLSSGAAPEDTGVPSDHEPINIISSTVENFAALRYDICKSCQHFFSPTTTCKKCGCFMVVKTRIPMAMCPIRKW
jgi:hypothetical protein